MNARKTLSLVLVVLILAGCAPAVLPSTPTSRVVAPGESARLPAEGSGPTVETPYLQLNLDVTDKQTGKHVDNAVVSVDGHELGRGCCLTVMIEATDPHTLTVTATGYTPWEVMLNPHIQHNTVMTAPVQLEPLKLETRGLSRCIKLLAPYRNEGNKCINVLLL